MLVDGGWGADRGFLEPDRGQYDEPVDVFAWCGAGVLFNVDYLRDAGLFDERFFMYYEDTDLAWRGRARGWRYRYVPTSTLRHVHSATSVEGSPLFQHYVERNRLVMLTKNAGGLAQTLWALGRAYRRAGRTAEAAAALRRSIPLWGSLTALDAEDRVFAACSRAVLASGAGSAAARPQTSCSAPNIGLPARIADELLRIALQLIMKVASAAA